MWIPKRQETISERPDEEQDLESIGKCESYHLETKSEKNLDYNKGQVKIGYDFLADNSNRKYLNVRSKNESSESEKILSKNSGAKINPLLKDIRQKQSIDYDSMKKGITSDNKKVTNYKEPSNQRKSKSNSYLEITANLYSLEDNQPIIQVEEAKQSKACQDDFTINQNQRGMHQEEIHKFNSIKSVTNSEKMRLYIRFKEAWNYFSSSDLTKEKSSIVVEDFSHLNCVDRIYLSCTKKFLLNYELLEERENVFALAKVSLYFSDEYHLRMITTLYKSLTGEIECTVKGEHWTKIGFQGSDPSTDLRSNGMLSILQTLAFLDTLNTYANEIYNYSLDNTFGFPFMCVLINLSYFSLVALREGHLIPFCNKHNSVINIVNDYFFGIIAHFYPLYRSSNKILDSVHSILNEVHLFAKKNPKMIFLLAKNVKTKYPCLNKDSMSLEGENKIE